jgi:hypothetical protein
MKKTIVAIQDNIKETYVKRRFLIFSRYEKIKETSMGKDLVISTEEEYDRIILN